MKHVKLISLLFIIPCYLFSQDTARQEKTNRKFGTEFAIYFGGQVNNFSNLNNRLKSLNITPAHSWFVNAGFGMAERLNKIIIGIDVSYGGAQTKGSTRIDGLNLHPYLSTNILKTSRWIFSPEIGYDEQMTRVKISQPGSSSSFNGTLTTNPNQVELHNDNTMIDFAMAFKFYNPRNGHNRSVCRIGYRYGPGQATWKIENSSVNDGPKDRVNNFYFQVMTGIGN
jgi:hypothetical protein